MYMCICVCIYIYIHMLIAIVSWPSFCSGHAPLEEGLHTTQITKQVDKRNYKNK